MVDNGLLILNFLGKQAVLVKKNEKTANVIWLFLRFQLQAIILQEMISMDNANILKKEEFNWILKIIFQTHNSNLELYNKKSQADSWRLLYEIMTTLILVDILWWVQYIGAWLGVYARILLREKKIYSLILSRSQWASWAISIYRFVDGGVICLVEIKV